MSSRIDYELESLQIGFEAGQADALSAWQTAFEETRNQWQTDRARRLLQMLKSSPVNDATLRVVKYYEATLFVNLGEWARARKAFEQSILLSRNLGDAIGELRAINGLANLLRRNADNLDSAEEVFHSALQSDSLDSSGRLALLNGRGLILYEKGDLGQAQGCFEEVLDLAKQSGDQELIASVYHNLGSIAWTRGRLQESRELLQKAVDLQQATQDLHGEAETLNSLGLLEEGLGGWEKAIETYRLALEKMEQAGDVYGQSQVLVNLGNVYSLRQENDRAFSCLEQAYEIAKELGNPRLQGQALTALGDMYRSKGELEKAAEFLIWAMDI
jgi:tetratricopeptide (TPR) repeat protein